MKQATSKEPPVKSRPTQEDGESAVLAKIAAMPDRYRATGERLHALILASGPELTPKLWYGMPAYARAGNVVCFFRGAPNERYMTIGFSDEARLDDGGLWPTAFALTELDADVEALISAYVQKAVKGQSFTGETRATERKR